MDRRFPLCFGAALALAACDQFGGGKVEVSGNAAAANASAGNAAAAAAPSAGITSSRSFAGLTGGEAGGDGGKDPAGAIQASAGEGVIDPRFVGRWTDNGDCKNVMDLRPDGTFVAGNGLEGTWRVDGGDLNFTANDQVIALRIDSVSPDRIVTTNAEGNTGPSTRC